MKQSLVSFINKRDWSTCYIQDIIKEIPSDFDSFIETYFLTLNIVHVVFLSEQCICILLPICQHVNSFKGIAKKTSIQNYATRTSNKYILSY